MIQAKPQIWADIIFRRYIFGLMKRSFSRIVLSGPKPRLPSDVPVVLLPNHSSWWDGFLVYLLNKRVFHRPDFLMMLEEQLQHYSFFRRLGAYSIDPGKPKSVAESLHYTRNLLSERNALVTIFPQGELRPWHQRPLGYRRLPEWLAKKSDRPLIFLPLAMRLEFREQRKPVALLKLGELRLVTASHFPKTLELEEEMTVLLDQMLQLPENPQSRVLLKGYRGFSDR
ncbi:MAG: hypothetical protein Kow0037_29050 [Calditrichia bacterium]